MQPQPQTRELTPEATQNKMTTDDPEAGTKPRTPRSEPAPKRRAIEGAKKRRFQDRVNEHLEEHEERLDRLEAASHTSNERLTSFEQTVHQLTANIHTTIQDLMTQMQAQLTAHNQAQLKNVEARMQEMEAQIVAKLQQSWRRQHAQQQQPLH